jgi:hypothetical protein
MRANNLKEYPVDEEGQPVGYDGYDVAAWVPNDPFVDTLEVTNCFRGRSAATFALKTKDGSVFETTLNGFFAMVTKLGVADAKIRGRFWVVKRGSNYRLEMHPDQNI